MWLAPSSVASVHRNQTLDVQLAVCFEQCFRESENVVCLGGAAEPFYEPGSGGASARLCYRQDFAASLLHEASHWCLASARRRNLPDFGFEYDPPPRSLVAQVKFLKQEVRAQALESLLASAAGLRFRCSYDDVDDLYLSLRPGFEAAVASTRAQFEAVGLPRRAHRLYTALLATAVSLRSSPLSDQDTSCSVT